jgi:hypothetical protein
MAKDSMLNLEVEVDCDEGCSGCCGWRWVRGDSDAANEASAPYPLWCLWVAVDWYGEAS